MAAYINVAAIGFDLLAKKVLRFPPAETLYPIFL